MGVSKTRIGAMRHRVTFQELVKTPDGMGGFESAWQNIAETPQMWGELKPLSASQRLFAERLEYQRTHDLFIRSRNDLTTEMRVTYDNRVFQIHGIEFADERRFFLLIRLEENRGS